MWAAVVNRDGIVCAVGIQAAIVGPVAGQPRHLGAGEHSQRVQCSAVRTIHGEPHAATQPNGTLFDCRNQPVDPRSPMEASLRIGGRR